MASRRRSARRRPASAAVSARPGAGVRAKRNRESRTGKITVACPQCGTQYRIPGELAENQVQCKNCPRAFFPKAASRRPRHSNSATPFIMGGAILAFLVIAAIIVSSGGQPAEAGDATEQAAAERPELGMKNPRVADCAKWMTALAEGDTFQLNSHTDFAALRELFGFEAGSGSEADLRAAVIDRLLNAPETELFRRSEVDTGSVEPDQAKNDRGEVRLYLSLREDFKKLYYKYPAQSVVAVRFTFADDRAKVVAWDVIAAPKLIPPPEPEYIVHEEIGVAKDVEREFGGQTVQVREAELVALPHLEGTPPETRQEIDRLIGQLCDIDAPGGLANRAIRRLKELGKPSVPRLLNKMFETPLDSQDNVLRLRRIAMALEDLTGQRFGFNPAIKKDTATASDDESRISALKQWYGWWADNHWREDFDYAIDKSDTLDTEPDKTDEGASKKPSRVFR